MRSPCADCQLYQHCKPQPPVMPLCLRRPGSSNSNHSSAHSHFLSPHISPVNSPAIRWSLPSIVFCHCRHYCHRNCLIRASQRVPEENLALVAQPQVSNAIAAQLKSKNFLISSNHYVMTPHLQMCANKTKLSLQK